MNLTESTETFKSMMHEIKKILVSFWDDLYFRSTLFYTISFLLNEIDKFRNGKHKKDDGHISK